MSSEPINTPSSIENTESKPIEVRVAAILNEREVAFNFGRNAGITIGMRFAILDELGEVLKDPATREPLGKVSPREKIRVQITEVDDKFSVARTYHVRRVNEGGTGAGLRGFAEIAGQISPPHVATYPYTFRKGEGAKEHFKKIKPEESVVKVGDNALQVFEENNEPTE